MRAACEKLKELQGKSIRAGPSLWASAQPIKTQEGTITADVTQMLNTS